VFVFKINKKMKIRKDKLREKKKVSKGRESSSGVARNEGCRRRREDI